jgi:hypothetical protein
MSSKYCCDNSTKDKALEELKCDKNPCCAVYNKEENVIYYHPKRNFKTNRKIGNINRKEGGIYDLHKAMMESMKNNSQTKPTIVKL